VVSRCQIPAGEFMTTLPHLLGTQLGGAILVYMAVLAAVQGWSYYLRFHERARAAAALEVERARLRASLSEARLEALQSQRNRISSSRFYAISTSPRRRKGANAMISHPSRFCAQTPTTLSHRSPRCRSVLQFLEAYLEIQKACSGIACASPWRSPRTPAGRRSEPRAATAGRELDPARD
jgi:hypothetical protein